MRSGDSLRAMALVALFWATPVSAQIDLDGGAQGFVWGSNCGATQLFKNNTGIPLAGLWVGINNDGINNSPEVRDISVHDQSAGRTWDVDDNEDFDNDDGSEGDEIDSTPLGLSSGWHRVQARANVDVLAVDENFTLRLCDSAGNSLSGRTIFLIPMAPQPGFTGGDQSRGSALPFGMSEGSPNGSASIDGAGAPPGSTKFSVGVTNTDGTKSLKRVQITPPSGVTILLAGAAGASYNANTRTIFWPSPILPGGTAQLNVELSSVSLRSLVTVVQFEGTQFVAAGPGPGVPALPPWGIALMIALLAIAQMLMRRRASTARVN